MPSEHAAMAAEVLVGANVRGIDSHGVPRTGAYAWRVDDGIESATQYTRCFAWGRQGPLVYISINLDIDIYRY